MHSRPIYFDPPPLTSHSFSEHIALRRVALARPDAGITLKHGYHGRLRSGGIVGPLKALDPGGEYAYVSDGMGWTLDGRYDAAAGETHPADIVETWRARRG